MTSFEKALQFIEQRWLRKTGKHLSPIQKAILHGSWEEEAIPYHQIAVQENYSSQYIQQVAAPQIWRILSDILGEPVSKKSFTSVVKNYLATSNLNNGLLEVPGDRLSLDSELYISRPIEQLAFQILSHAGGVLSLVGSRKMGKTSLMIRLVHRARQENLTVVPLSLEQVDPQFLKNLDQFLRWLIYELYHRLNLSLSEGDFSRDGLGCKGLSTHLLEHLLEQINSPLVVVIDQFDLLFNNLPISTDFLRLLNYWYEASGYGLPESDAWQKLRFILVTSTDIYAELNLKSSPIRTGKSIKMPYFTTLEVDELTRRFSLQLTSSEVEELVQLTGGHPYLVGLSLYASSEHYRSFKSFLKDSLDAELIFHKHLHFYGQILQKNITLLHGFQEVVQAQEAVRLSPFLEFQLESLGLVKLGKNGVTVANGLYRRYFGDRL
ncbi:MAG: AAA-like domain-containing protein [Roseofilum sp. SBFL]|uniref:AAA-like domain-containing protein n=1 Tax=unclassified Roseofilum TaxID=2620099 RepID=UPI001B0CD089|nr:MULTISPECIES: AAA-like domain-containing protein [unclassified Roseofilum]MBP0014773.1 AAA-like domain-containing protein [Roseofilum sp. SID3]MBP0024134.1 AAA-like domain-containing protein [Roseofilum sp. SID2]MBP0038025.1 AAA-like domain-containing protein [Roseofilum sp. SID1]MBP0042629.1 AAA-like domain-containing protein [Roseofilum sp. SBFL]